MGYTLRLLVDIIFCFYIESMNQTGNVITEMIHDHSFHSWLPSFLDIFSPSFLGASPS